MVKHQRRSHQRGLHPNEIIDDDSSESEGPESPSTPRLAGVPWPPQNAAMDHGLMSSVHPIQRAVSVNGYPHNIGPYAMQTPYQQRQAIPGCHTDYHGNHVMNEQSQSVNMLQRASSMPQHTYYLGENRNPGVPVMTAQQVQAQYAIPRQQNKRPNLDIPYPGSEINTPIQNSPGNFSAASGRSPSTHDNLYVHGASHNGGYTLHHASPQPEPVVQYQQPMVQQLRHQPQQHIQRAPAPAPAALAHQTAESASAEDYRVPSPEAVTEPEPWYQYPPQIEVTTIGQLPPYGMGVYDIYGGAKYEFEDPSMPLPSSRIETL
jgi:hypothetical protein